MELTPLAFVRLLSDPQRWHILQELSLSDRRVSELTQLLGRPQNLVSYHLRELRSAGLVAAKPSAADGRDTYYRVELDRCADLLSDVGSALQPGIRLEPVAPQLPGHLRHIRVLFLCTGNSSRSQMAEALLRERTGGQVQAFSAGSHPKSLHANAVRIMAERGIDISGQHAKHLRRFARRRFDHIITLCDRVREICPEFPGQPRTAHWSVADPALAGDTDEASYPAFEQAADEIERRVRTLIAQLAHQHQEVSVHGQNNRQRPLSRR